MSFYKTAIKIALISLILFTIILIITIWNSNTSKGFPPEIPSCPDHWEPAEGDSDELICTNNLGSSSIDESPNFNQQLYKGQKGLCEKQKWAKTNSIHWSGITDVRFDNCD